MIIYIIGADRGDYSDRTEYVVAWTSDKAKAEARAAWLNEQSAIQQRRVNNSSLPYGESWSVAQAELGDLQWSPSDETTYGVQELEELP